MAFRNLKMEETLLIFDDSYEILVSDRQWERAAPTDGGRRVHAEDEYNLELSGHRELVKWIQNELTSIGYCSLAPLIDALGVRDRILFPFVVEAGFMLEPELRAYWTEDWVSARATYGVFVPAEAHELLSRADGGAAPGPAGQLVRLPVGKRVVQLTLPAHILVQPQAAQSACLLSGHGPPGGVDGVRAYLAPGLERSHQAVVACLASFGERLPPEPRCGHVTVNGSSVPAIGYVTPSMPPRHRVSGWVALWPEGEGGPAVVLGRFRDSAADVDPLAWLQQCPEIASVRI